MRLFIAILSILFMSAGSLNGMNNPEFIQLEQKIVKFLENSWCSEQKARLILEFVVAHRPEICVEVGVFTGSSALPMLAGLKYIKHGRAYLIDAWSNEEAIRGLPKEDPNIVWWASLNMPSIKDQFNKTMARWSLASYFQVLHMSSKQAISQLPQIDFLHLDGNFSEEGSLLDSQLYLSKVVSGGYILISNTLTMIGKQATKMKALGPLFEQCEIVDEIENGNVLLFKKK